MIFLLFLIYTLVSAQRPTPQSATATANPQQKQQQQEQPTATAQPQQKQQQQQQNYLSCSGDITLQSSCDVTQGNPSCKFIKNNQQLICDTALNYVPYFAAYSGDGCLIYGSSMPQSSCTYIQDYIHNVSDTSVPQICCTQTCPQIDTIENIPAQCSKSAPLYRDFLNGQNQLSGPQADTIIANIMDEEEMDIGDTLGQISALTINTLAANIPFVSKTGKFNLYAIMMDEEESNVVEHSNLKITLPPVNIINTSLSTIYWKNNPYENVTNATIKPDTNIISVTLRNFSGVKINAQSLNKPIQMSWSVNNTIISNSTNNTNLTAECLYWNTTILNWDTYGCYPVKVNSSVITCNCTHLTDFGARFRAVFQSNKEIFTTTSIAVYSLEGLKTYYNFYIIFASLGAFGLLTFAVGVYLDAYDSKTYYSHILLNPIIQKIAKKYIVDVCRINRVSPLHTESKKDIPKPSKPSLLYIMLNRILLQHSQLSAFVRYDPRLSRIFRFLLIFVGLFNSLFLTGFMYGFTYGSDEIAVASMSLVDSVILSLVTAALNYPCLILLSSLINSAGLAEFAWRYPVILDELIRRHRFENEISMYDEVELNTIDKSKLVYTEPQNIDSIHNISTVFNTIQNYFIGAVGAVTAVFTKKPEALAKKPEAKEKPKEKEKGEINKAYSYAQKPYINPKSAPYYYSYLPFHTYIGGAVFSISLGWFAWCLNYLLLFSANHDNTISDSVLTSFGLNELETIVLIQPISILLVMAVSYCVRKVTKGRFENNKLNVPSLYYFSDPYVQSDSTQFSTHLAFDIFVNIPSQISRTINQNSIKEKNLGYAALQTVLDFIDTGDTAYAPTTKEERIEYLYNSMNPLYSSIDVTFDEGLLLFKHSNKKPQTS